MYCVIKSVTSVDAGCFINRHTLVSVWDVIKTDTYVDLGCCIVDIYVVCYKVSDSF